MKVKALVAFKSKLFTPCRKLLTIFKFRFKKPLFIRTLRSRPHNAHAKPKKTPLKRRITPLLSIFRSPRQSKDMDRLKEIKSFSDTGRDRMLFPLPITPAYIRSSGGGKKEALAREDVEDACRSFENYLVEMIVEEGKVRDLMDVEELLYCWKNLKCPVFINLVCRFYGELCKDLFSSEEDDDVDSP